MSQLETNALEPPVNKMTKRDVAREWQTCERTVNTWMDRGIIPYLKVGRLVRFERTEVEAALLKFRRGSIGEPKRK